MSPTLFLHTMLMFDDGHNASCLLPRNIGCVRMKPIAPDTHPYFNTSIHIGQKRLLLPSQKATLWISVFNKRFVCAHRIVRPYRASYPKKAYPYRALPQESVPVSSKPPPRKCTRAFIHIEIPCAKRSVLSNPSDASP